MTRRAYTPRPYADLATDFLASVPRGNLWAGMGLGKTVINLTMLNTAYNVLGEDQPTLVLAPLRVAKSTWPTESQKWEHLSGLEVVSITGDADERAAALKRDAPVYAMNYDNLPWLREHLGKRWPFRRVIADESTRLKSYRTRNGGIRATTLAEIAHTVVKEWINLTGTPAPNGLFDVWGQQWFVDAGIRLGRTYGAYQERYFRPVRNDEGYYDWFPMETTQHLVQERLKDCTLTIDPKDWFDLEDPIVNVIEVELPKSARQKYRELEKEMFIQLDEQRSVEVFNAAALTTKCLQLANGAVYLDPARYGPDVAVEVHYAKLEALESVIEEAGGAPILVAYHFKSDLARLQRAFPQGRTLDADPRTIDAWNGGRIPLLFAHPASAGHGLNLQDGGNIVVFFGQWWDLEQHDQIIERIGPVRQLQAGHQRPVFIHYIVAKDTIDELVMARRSSKRGVQNMLLEYMKERA